MFVLPLLEVKREATDLAPVVNSEGDLRPLSFERLWGFLIWNSLLLFYRRCYSTFSREELLEYDKFPFSS